jgi:hypothetical protein
VPAITGGVTASRPVTGRSFENLETEQTGKPVAPEPVQSVDVVLRHPAASFCVVSSSSS